MLQKVSVSTESIRNLINNAFHKHALDSLLFTNVIAIEAWQRVSIKHKPASVWSVTVQRKLLEESYSAISQELHIEDTGVSGDHAQQQTWTVVTHTISEDNLLRGFADMLSDYHMKAPLRVGVAASHDVVVSGRVHRLFATLPLPVPVPLPVHVNLPFVLADDRRAIRFDDAGQANQESRFNHWLLSHLLPPVYLHLLETLPHSEYRYWPKPTDDRIAAAVIKSFYSKLLAGSPRPICQDLHEKRIPPIDSTFSVGEEPLHVTLALKIMKLSGLVEVPTSLRSVIASSGVNLVTPEYVSTIIRREAARFRREFLDKDTDLSIRHVSRIVDYLAEDQRAAPNLLHGLPLIPLADGELAFVDSTRPTVIYTRFPLMEPVSIFPGNRFVHGDYMPSVSTEDRRSLLKVSLLTSEAVTALIQERLGNHDQRHLNDEDQRWVSTMWNVLDSLPESTNLPVNLDNIPVVPTTQGSLHISMNRCNMPDVLVHGGELGLSPLLPIFEALGAIGVHKYTYLGMGPRLIAQSTDLEALIMCFRHLGASNVSNRMSDLQESQRETLADWIHSRLALLSIHTQKEAVRSLLSLPLWKGYRGDSARQWCKAENSKMLPERVEIMDVRRFLPSAGQFYLPFSTQLSRLGKEPLKFRQLRDELVLSMDTLPLDASEDYTRLLQLIISQREQDGRSFLIPNGGRRMTHVNELYSSQEPLFATVFERQPERFVHADFRNWESDLERFGLQREITLQAFRVMASSISQEAERNLPDVVVRATPLYAWYHQQLPGHNQISAGGREWRDFDAMRFIPKRHDRHHILDWRRYVSTVRPLAGALLRPTEVLRPGLEALAWTTRAMPEDRPSDRLYEWADPSWGIPSASEVVSYCDALIDDFKQTQLTCVNRSSICKF
jgi:hypothetical protein